MCSLKGIGIENYAASRVCLSRSREELNENYEIDEHLVLIGLLGCVRAKNYSSLENDIIDACNVMIIFSQNIHINLHNSMR